MRYCVYDIVPRQTLFLFLLVLSLLCTRTAFAGTAAGTAPPALSSLAGPTVRVYFENDLFYNEDREYTNAVQLRVISPDLRTVAENGFLPEGLSRLLETVPFPGSRSAIMYSVSAGFGQHIYTPRDTQSRDLQADDRPYAGYLYGMLALHAKRASRLDTLELTAGIIGPSSLAEQAQNEVHRFRSIDTAKGWQHQLRDEPAAMLTWSRVWRLNDDETSHGWGWDVLPQVNFSLGTPYTRAGIGAELRFGWNLPPDYGSSTIRPGSGITRPLTTRPLRAGQRFLDNLSIYAFAGADGYAVAWNSFLDGNIWKNSHRVDKKPLTGALNWGLVVGLYDFQVSYTRVHRGMEYFGQSGKHDYGSITLSYKF